MSYPSIKETFYHAEGKRQAVLTVPHGASAREFLEHFPEIEADPQLQKVWPLFQSYLQIEQDFGATELAHSLAFEMQASYGISTRVVELNYPRGIVDGGRLRGHGLRSCLPTELFCRLQERFSEIHEDSLKYMDDLYKEFSKENCFLLDLHTMASYCPVDAAGKKSTFPISFPRLEDYVNQYFNAQNHAFARKIDLICSDEKGRKLAHPVLLSAVARELYEAGYACLENEPYHAAPIYLSHQHMQMVPSLSIDVPKHLVASGVELDQLSLNPQGIQRLAFTLAKAVFSAYTK